MGRFTLAQKIDRVMRLLVGLRRRPVAAALAAHGFRGADIDEVFGYLRTVTVSDVDALASAAASPAAHADRIAEWVKRWQPILEPAVRRRDPAIANRLFTDLGKGEVRDRTYAIAKFFVDTHDELARSSDPVAADVIALLKRKGLTDAVLAELRDLLAPTAAAPDWPIGDFDEAETKLWEWYAEWSAVVRARVHDKRLRRELGIGATADADERDVS